VEAQITGGFCTGVLWEGRTTFNQRRFWEGESFEGGGWVFLGRLPGDLDELVVPLDWSVVIETVLAVDSGKYRLNTASVSSGGRVIRWNPL
jgi:hypothetical protein